jgi:hypothetical protein
MNASNATQNHLKVKRKLSVIERYMLANPLWQEGYQSFNRLFGRPMALLFVIDEDGRSSLIRLDRKGGGAIHSILAANQQSWAAFHLKYGDQLIQSDQDLERMPTFYRDVFGRNGAIFALNHLGKTRALLF